MYSSNFSIDKRDWINTPISKGRVIKQKPTVKAKWMIFYRMSEVEHDPYWSETWLNGSKGRFPIGFSFNGKELSYSSTRNRSSKVVITNNIEEMCHLCKHMYQQCAWIFSALDIQLIREREELSQDYTREELISWTDFDQTQKDSLVVQYVIELSQEKNFDKEDMNELWQTILAGINISILGKNNIVIKGGKIVNIKNLKWDEEQRVFYIDVKIVKIKKSSNNATRKNKILSIRSTWEKLNQTKRQSKKKVHEIRAQDLEDSVSASYYPE